MVQIYRAKKTPSPSRPAKLTLTVDRLDLGGQGVCATHQPIVFVEGVLPGEECQVQVIEQKPRFWRGKLLKISQPSPLRQDPFCPHFDACGGCQTQYAGQADMLSYKQLAVSELLQRVADISAPPWQAPLIDKPQAYRRKTRLALDCRNKAKPLLGFRAKGSKQLVAISECPILVDALQTLIGPMQSLIAKLHSPGNIGHISLLKGENKPQLCLRLIRELNQADLSLLSAFSLEHACQIVLEDSKNNFVAVGGAAEPVYYLLDSGIKIYLQPNDFVQVNANINQQMITQAIDWLKLDKDDEVLDLFCGVGNFSLPMARQCKQVRGIEGVSEMVQRATDNALKNGIDNSAFYQCDLNQADSLSQPEYARCNKVLLDPAREGALALMPQLARLRAARILYVSCNPATFVRDSKLLLEQGYCLDKVGLMDMFPNTAHTELMALFVHNHTFKN